MTAGDHHERGPIGGAAGVHLTEPVVVHDRTGWHRVRRISRIGLLAAWSGARRLHRFVDLAQADCPGPDR